MNIDHFVLLRQMTHEAMPPKSARKKIGSTVIRADVPKADQKLKLLLLTTDVRFFVSFVKLIPVVLTGFANYVIGTSEYVYHHQKEGEKNVECDKKKCHPYQNIGRCKFFNHYISTSYYIVIPILYLIYRLGYAVEDAVDPKLSMNYTRSLPIMVFIFPSVRSSHLNI